MHNQYLTGKVSIEVIEYTVYPKKYAHGYCFAVLCCGYTLTDFPISIRLTSLALWQSNDCPSASKASLMNMDKYFMWMDYERLHNHNKAKHNKTVCIFLGIYCNVDSQWASYQIRKIVCCACAGIAGNVFPATSFKGKRKLVIPACITARASRTCRDACWDLYSVGAGKMFPAFPAHAQPAILRIWQEAHERVI